MKHLNIAHEFLNFAEKYDVGEHAPCLRSPVGSSTTLAANVVHSGKNYDGYILFLFNGLVSGVFSAARVAKTKLAAPFICIVIMAGAPTGAAAPGQGRRVCNVDKG